MKIILFRGQIGTGKTTFSNLLAKETGFPILRKDDIYDVASGIIKDHQERNEISYGSLYAILKSNARNNCVFIVDYPFYSTDHFSIIKKWCKNNKVELKSILSICSDEIIWDKRLVARTKNPKPNQHVTNIKELKKHCGNIEISPEKGELVIDTIKSKKTLLDDIKAFIGKKF